MNKMLVILFTIATIIASTFPFTYHRGYLAGMSKTQSDVTPVMDDLFREIADLESQLERDDNILSRIFGAWDRSLPVLSKQVTVTCYTSRVQETDSTPHITASNEIVQPGTIALSRDLLPVVGGFGSRVVIVGYGLFTVTDVMNKRYTNSVDIWTGDLKAARLHGRQQATIMWQ